LRGSLFFWLYPISLSLSVGKNWLRLAAHGGILASAAMRGEIDALIDEAALRDRLEPFETGARENPGEISIFLSFGPPSDQHSASVCMLVLGFRWSN
jgi:hypothetical protein